MAGRENISNLITNVEDFAALDPEKGLKKVLELYTELKDSNDYNAIGKLCKLLGTLYLKNSNSQVAIEYYEQAIINFNLANDYKEIAGIYNNLVIAAYYHHTYEKIEQYSRLAIKYYDKAGDKKGSITVINNLGKFYKNIEAFEKAYHLFKNTLKNHSKTLDRNSKNVVLANYASVCLHLNKIEEGLKILNELDKTTTENNEYEVITLVNTYLGNYYESVGDYKKALDCHKKKFQSTMIDKQQNMEIDINNYLRHFDINVSRLQYDRIIKQNEELIKVHSVVSQKNGFLETLIDTIPLPLFYCTMDMIYLGCNNAFCNYFSVQKDELVSKKKAGFTISNQEERHLLLEKINQLKTQQTPLHFITQITKKGEKIIVEIFLSLFYHKDGSPEGILAMIQDKNLEFEQQRQVKEINAHLNSVLDSAKMVYICSIDKNYNYRYINKNYAHKVKEHTGIIVQPGDNYFIRYQDPEIIAKKKESLKKVFSGETVSGIREYNYDDCNEILQYFYSPIKADDDEVIGVTVFSYDITERVIAQRELSLSNATKDKFFSIIAHDLRSPIGNIKAALEFITKDKDLSNEEVMDMLTKLANSAINTYDLLENLLQWSLNQRGLGEIKASKHNLSALIKDAYKTSDNISHAKNIDIKLDCDLDIMVICDKNMFYTVLRNLLNNAIKYSYKDSDIQIVVKKIDNLAEIKVIDHGVGIEASKIEELKQMETTSSTFGTAGESGSGLGLVLCNDLLNKMGGKLIIESKLGKGSTFGFTLPIAR